MDKTLYYMQKAIEQAEIAAAENEVPVGAVIVRNDEIVATGRNRREQGKNALLHAETDAIYNACQKLGGWRLWNCEIYVTLEPCPMCAGAIINAHIPKVYFGAYDLKNGACGTITNLFQMPFNFKPESVGGIMQEECSKLLTDFFKNLRNKNHRKIPLTKAGFLFAVIIIKETGLYYFSSLKILLAASITPSLPLWKLRLPCIHTAYGSRNGASAESSIDDPRVNAPAAITT